MPKKRVSSVGRGTVLIVRAEKREPDARHLARIFIELAREMVVAEERREKRPEAIKK